MTPTIYALSFAFTTMAQCVAWVDANVPTGPMDPEPYASCIMVNAVPMPSPVTSLRPKMRPNQ